MKLKSIAVLTLISGMVFWACGKKNSGSEGMLTDPKIVSSSVKIAWVIGNNIILREGKEIKAELGFELTPADSVATGSNGSMEIMIGETGIIKLSKNTKLSVQSLLNAEGKSDTNVKINYGKVVTLLKKERKDESFNVLTPTTIAGVRGTSFLTSVEDLSDAGSNRNVSCDGKSCRITFAVVEGKIALTKPGSTEEIILEKNSQITIDRERKLSNKMVKPLNKESLKELKNMIVFHKNDVLGFSKLVDELKLGSEELRNFESSGSIEELKMKMSKRESSSNLADEVARTASKVDESKYVKKDVGKENLKLQANKSYE